VTISPKHKSVKSGAFKQVDDKNSFSFQTYFLRYFTGVLPPPPFFKKFDCSKASFFEILMQL